MAKLLNFQTGQVEEVADEAVPQAVASGGFGLKAGAPVHLVNQDGERFTIDPTEAADAFRRGFSYVPEAQVQQEATEKEFGDRDGAAFAAGAARGLTLGLSDLALEKSGLVESRTLKGLQDANPVSSGVGEVVGAVAPALLPGGQFTLAGGVGRLGAVAAERTAARLGGRALAKVAGGLAAGAVEGSLFGAGGAVTESVLGDSELNGEKLLAHAGLGALAGAAGGALGAGVGVALEGRAARGAAKAAAAAGKEASAEAAGASGALGGTPGASAPSASAGEAAADAAQASAPDLGFGKPLEDFINNPGRGKRLQEVTEKHWGKVKGLLEDMDLRVPDADEWTLRSLDLTGRQVQKLEDKGLVEAAPALLREDSRWAAAKTMDKRLDLVRTKRAEGAKAIGDALDTLDAAMAPEERLSTESVANRILDEVAKPIQAGPHGNKAVLNRVLQEADALLEMGPEGGLKEMDAFRRNLDDYIGWDSPEPKPVQEALRKIRGILNNEVEQHAQFVAQRMGKPEVFDALKAGKRTYQTMSELDKLATQRMSAGKGNRFLSLTDNIAGAAGLAAGGLNPAGLALAGGAAVLNKWGRERLPHLLSLWMERAETPGATQKAATGLKHLVDELLEKGAAGADNAAEAAGAAGGRGATAPGAIPGVPGAVPGAVSPSAAVVEGAFGRYTPILAAATARGAAALFATHAALADSDPEYRQQMQMAGLDFTPGKDAGAHARAERLGGLEKRLQDADKATATGLDAFLAKRKAARPVQTREGRLAAFQKRSDELAQLAANPNLLTERLANATQGLGDDAPAVASAMMAAATRGVAFLQQKAPKPPPQALDIPALRRPWQPPDAELSRFERYAAAVDNPGGVLEDMAAGTVTREAVEALQAVYPKAFEDMKAKLLERLASHGTALDYSQRLALGQVLGQPVDEASAPQRLAQLQATFAASPPQAPARRGSGGSPFSLASDTQSDTERLMARRS